MESIFNNVYSSKSMLLRLQVNAIALVFGTRAMVISEAAIHGGDSICFVKERHPSARFIQRHCPRSQVHSHHPGSPMGREKLPQSIKRSKTCNFFNPRLLYRRYPAQKRVLKNPPTKHERSPIVPFEI
jgi:hypothetical protein